MKYTRLHCLIVQAALNLDASVNRLGFCGGQQEQLWCLSHTDTLHLWDWQAACNEESEGASGHLWNAFICIYKSVFQENASPEASFGSKEENSRASYKVNKSPFKK